MLPFARSTVRHWRTSKRFSIRPDVRDFVCCWFLSLIANDRVYVGGELNQWITSFSVRYYQISLISQTLNWRRFVQQEWCNVDTECCWLTSCNGGWWLMTVSQSLHSCGDIQVWNGDMSLLRPRKPTFMQLKLYEGFQGCLVNGNTQNDGHGCCFWG